MIFKNILKPIGTGKASALIAFTSFLSYAVGLVRDRAIAVHFGTTTATDTYNASFLIPDILFNMFIAGALTAAFMPMFSDYLNKDEKQASSLANTMLSGASIFIAILSVIAFIFMGKIIPSVFPSVSIEGQKDIILMTRLMLPSAFMFAISNTLGNILMTYRHFFSFAISPIVYNLGIIFGVFLLNDRFGIYSAAIGVLIGAFLHLAVRLADVFSTKYRYKPEFKFSHPGFRKILKLMIPKSISLMAWQLNLYIFAVVGMRMVEGGLSAFNFARNIQSFAVSLFGIAFATAVFPNLNTAISNGDKVSFTKDIQKTIQRIVFFSVPAAVGLAMLAKPITDLILGGGEFGEKSLHLTSLILVFFAISIPFESLSHLLARSYYAMKNTMTPMIINVFSLGIIAMITIFIAPRFGIEWFSIGFTIGFVTYNLLFFALLSRHLEKFDIKNFSISITKTIISTSVMGAVLYLTRDMGDYVGISEKISGGIRIAIGGITFLAFARLLKSNELMAVTGIFERFFNKKIFKNGLIIILIVSAITLFLSLEKLQSNFSTKASEDGKAYKFTEEPLGSSFLEVPFICQAPLQTDDNWKYHEESCEEAAVLQAYLYMTGQSMTKQEAHEEILKMISWQIEHFGEHRDIYADEVKEFIHGYYGIKTEEIEVLYNVTIEKVKEIVSKGFPVIVPIMGDILKNPYYPYPGYHMLVVKGYTKDSIITNDNGTRRGENFSYKNDVFQEAMTAAGGDIVVIKAKTTNFLR